MNQMLSRNRNLLLSILIILVFFGLAEVMMYKMGRISSELKQSRTEITFLETELDVAKESESKLKKTAEIDEELLQKYSKIYFLNEHYVPASLSDVPERYLFEGVENFQFHTAALPYLRNLLQSAEVGNMSLLVTSAYRSFSVQAALKKFYIITYGATAANRFSADQGYSEHQLGTTVDFTTKELNGALEGFNGTSEYAWLLTNAHKYGFILSYPAGNAYYKFEPWHWRFVGVELATKLYQDKINFYEMDQREIDKYLANIFD